MRLSEYIEELTKHLEDCKSRGIDPVCYKLTDSENGIYDLVWELPEKRYTKRLHHFIEDVLCEDDVELNSEKIEDYIEIAVIN